MPKKSRRNRPNSAQPAAPSAPPSDPPVPVLSYPSDGPTEVELLQTESPSLQSKLDSLTRLAAAGDRRGFVEAFVPLDLSRADREGYLEELLADDEHWANVTSEIAAIAAGRGVERIEGDQRSRATFYFRHPRHQNCDREVAFCCVQGEWRAEG